MKDEGNETVTNCHALKMRKCDPELDARWGTICTPTRMQATDGKYYNTQAATMEGVFRIIQSIPSMKAEPFKQWMALTAPIIENLWIF